MFRTENFFNNISCSSLQSMQANVVCVVYDVTNEDTIDKVSYLQLFFQHISVEHINKVDFHTASFFQIKTKWIPLVNGDAEKGNKYVSLVLSVHFYSIGLCSLSYCLYV